MLIHLSCPKCAANLDFDDGIHFIKCEFCGATSLLDLEDDKPSLTLEAPAPEPHGPSDEVLISIQNLKVHYSSGGGFLRPAKVVKAVDGVSLDIRKGETLGLVGESGCGKSTLGKAILRLTEPTGGKVLYNGKDLASLPKSAMREQRKDLQMIFQDPYASLNPRMTVGQIIGEPLRTFGLTNGSTASRVEELMETVGLSRRFIKRYPHEFSGGQRQRIGIARALAVDPEFIVADEPISALDVSIQAQIMNLMERLQAEKNLTYLFISHDLRAVRHLSDRVAVMYLGRIVELAGGREIYRDPLMPYTQALISAVPVPDPEIEARRERIILKGDVPSPINPPTGCHFHTRCQFAIDACKTQVPQLVEIKPDHFAACIRISPEHPIIEANASDGLGAIGN
ncbi:MAG: ATP-binding cassette domain-containing protein [Chloracidobacterium sp.]|nr:ATP-binding cassette domain-containing protein [Chloracidobacterium sp.]